MSKLDSVTSGSGPGGSRGPRLKLTVAFVVAALVALLLTACGGSSSDSTSSETSAETNAETTVETGEASAGGGGASTATGKELNELIGTPEGGPEAGEGETVKMGAILALSSSGAFYGKESLHAIELASEEIEAAGGPKLELIAKDHKSGDTQAGITATRELGSEGVPIAQVSYSGVLGSILPGVEQYKMLAIDAGGGAAPAIQEKPYFYGFRDAPNTDSTKGLLEYVKAKYPEIKKLSYVSWDVGPTITGPSEDLYQEAMKENGLTNTGSHLVTIGDTDYSDVIAELKQEQPEAIFSQIYGAEAGYFAKQMAAAGMNIPIFGSDYIQEAGPIGGAAMKNYTFGFSFFQPEAPENEWAERFVEKFEAKFGDEPSYFAANYYESTFAVWQMAREVIAAGGDLGSGEAFLEALEANPTFPSLYGGDGGKAGSQEIDLKTHAPAARAQGVYTCDANCANPTRVATFNTEGSEFKLVE